MRKITSADAIFFQSLFRETPQSSYIIEVSASDSLTYGSDWKKMASAEVIFLIVATADQD